MRSSEHRCPVCQVEMTYIGDGLWRCEEWITHRATLDIRAELAAERERTADALARLDATNARLQSTQEWAKRWANAARALHLFIRSSRNARDVKQGMIAQHRWRLTVLERKRQEAKLKRKRQKESTR